MKNIFGVLLALCVLTVGAFLLYRSWPSGSDKPVVAASIFPLADITRNIAGDTLTVLTVLPPNGNPHTFEPTPSDVKQLSQAQVFYKIGSGLDDWIDPLVQSAVEEASKKSLGRTGASVKSVSDNILMLPSHDAEEGPVDPHYWLTIPNAKQIAITITKDLSSHFPEHAAVFTANRDTYLTKLDAAETQMQNILTDVENRNLIAMHDAWYYFAQGYGLTIAGSFEPTGGKEPTPQYLADLLAAVKNAGVDTIYSEPQSSDQAMRTFAEDNDLTLAELDDLGGTPGKMTYIDLLLTNARTIAQNQ